MFTRIHMQDQVTNRIESLMNHHYDHYPYELSRNVATLILAVAFLSLCFNW